MTRPFKGQTCGDLRLKELLFLLDVILFLADVDKPRAAYLEADKRTVEKDHFCVGVSMLAGMGLTVSTWITSRA